MSTQVASVSKKTLKNRKRRQKRNQKRKNAATSQKVPGKIRPIKTKASKSGKNNSQKHMVKLAGGLNADDRDFRRDGLKVKNASTDNYMKNLANEIAFDVTPPSSVFYAMPASLVSLCLQRGWMAGAETPSIPFLAFGYLCYIVQSFAVNGVVPVVRLPKCVALYCQSVTSKSVITTGGKVNYKFNFVQDVDFPSTLTLGPTMNALWSLGIPNSSSTTGVWANAMTPGSWSVSAGQTAYQSLTQFLEDSEYAVKGSMLELVSSTDLNKMSKDVSAFAVTYADPGGAYKSTGGFGKQIYQEVNIHSPLFAVNYSNPGNILDVDRYASFTSSFAGSGFLLGLLATVIKEKWVGMKTPPTMKCIDLNEFIEVYALILQKALYNALNDPQTMQQLLTMNPADVQAYLYANYQCPLTLQEFSVLLRDLMMNLLKDTQYAVQDIFPRSSAVEDVSLFTACVAGTNSCGLGGSTSMLGPRILFENMRSCTFGLIESGKNGRNPIIALPVLGIYSGVVLNTADYTVSVVVNSTTYSTTVFAYNAEEVPISLIDGTTNGFAQTVFINDPAQNNMLTSEYNNWINGPSQVATFISSLTTLSTDRGVGVLTNMNITEYWTEASDSSAETKRKRRAYWKAFDAYQSLSEKEKVKSKEPVPDWNPTSHELRFGRKNRRMSHLDTSPYATAVVQNVSCRFPLLAAVWEGGQQFFIKPVINAVTDATVSASNQISRIGAQQREFNNLIISIGTTTQLTLAYLHDQLADMCVCSRNGASKGTDFESQLKLLSETGGGSIFTDIASQFAGIAGAAAQVGIPIALSMLKKQNRNQRNMIMPTQRNMIMG